MSFTDVAGGDWGRPQKNKCLPIHTGMNCGVPLLESQGQSLPAGDFGQFMENLGFIISSMEENKNGGRERGNFRKRRSHSYKER